MLSAQVVDGRFAKDGSSFADFEYDVVVIFNGISTTLKRNFLDFCELESMLRNAFRDVTLPSCHSLETMHSWQATSKSPRSSLESLRRVTLGGGDDLLPCDTYRMARNRYLVTAGVAPIFRIDRSVSDLNTWMLALLQYPFILKYRTFAMFLCPAIEPYRTQSDHALNDVSYIDFLLPAKQLKNKQVITKFCLPIEVQSGQLIVWRFINKPYDISFAVDFNGEYLIDPARHASMVEHCGAIAVPASPQYMNAGICEGRWENKYNAMMLPSTLQYVYRAAEMSEAEDAKRRAAERNTTIRHMRDELQQLETALVAHAATVLEQSIQVALETPLPASNASLSDVPVDVTPQSETEQMRSEIVTLRKQLRTLRRQYVALQLEKRCSKCKQQELSRGLSEVDDFVVVGEDEDSETTEENEEEPIRRASSAPELSSAGTDLLSAAKSMIGMVSPSLISSQASTNATTGTSEVPDYVVRSSIFSPDALALEFDDWYHREFGEHAGKVRQTDALGGSGVLHNRLVSWAKRRVSDIFRPLGSDELGMSSSHHTAPPDENASAPSVPAEEAPVAPHIFDDSGDSDDSSDEVQSNSEVVEQSISEAMTEPAVPEVLDEHAQLIEPSMLSAEESISTNMIPTSTTEDISGDVSNSPVAIEVRGAWSRYYSAVDERDYYYNATTQENQWEVPSEWNDDIADDGNEEDMRESQCSSVTEEVRSHCEDDGPDKLEEYDKIEE